MKIVDQARSMMGKALGRPERDDEESGGGAKEGQTLELVAQLKQESWDYINASGPGERCIRDEWTDNANRFVGNFRTGMDSGSYATSASESTRIVNGQAINSGRVGLKRAFLMRTQNSVMANVASATATPVYGRLAPVEFGEEDAWFLTPRGGKLVKGAMDSEKDARRAELEQLASESVQAAQANPEDEEAAISAEQARHLLTTVDEDIDAEWGGLTVDQLGGDDGPSEMITEDQHDLLMEKAQMGTLPLRDSDIIAMTDRFISQRAQQVCDVLTDNANMPIYWLMYAMQSNITGHACGEFEWHTSGRFRNTFTFDISHPMNVFTDPCHWDMRFRSYHIEENVVPVDKLVNRWPEFAERLKDAAAEGQRSSEDGTALGGTSENINFQRKMVTITTSWIRDQTVPMSPEDAVAEGLVVEQPVYTDQDSQAPAYDEETGEPLKRYYLAGPPAGPLGGDEDPGNELPVSKAPSIGEPTEPQDRVGHGTNWPDGPGLRQIVSCRSGQFVIEDVRCPYPDIPRVWSMNIPRPDGSPFGQGEPVRLKHIDEIINYTLSMLVNYLATLGFPTCVWPQTLMAKMRKAGVQLNLRPNMHIPVPDEKWMMLMQAGGTDRLKFKQEPLPPSYANFLEQMLKEHDSMSGNVDVRQGRAPYSGASGKTISELKQGAESSLSIKSRLLEQGVIDFYRLLIHAVTSWLPESEWQKILNRYELPVIREVIRRVRKTQWDVSVKVSSGRGQDDDFEQDKALAMYDRQLVGGEDVLQKLGDDDPAGTSRKAKEWHSPQAPADQPGATADPNVN